MTKTKVRLVIAAVGALGTMMSIGAARASQRPSLPPLPRSTATVPRGPLPRSGLDQLESWRDPVSGEIRPENIPPLPYHDPTTGELARNPDGSLKLIRPSDARGLPPTAPPSTLPG